MTNFMNKKTTDLTVGETLMYGVAVYAVGAAIMWCITDGPSRLANSVKDLINEQIDKRKEDK